MGTKMSNSKVIDRTIVGGKYLVSTVRLFSADHVPNLYEGHIFETMVFACDADGAVTDWMELDGIRYRTIDEARTGHNDMVRHWTNRS
jgi:hypothetical protein